MNYLEQGKANYLTQKTRKNHGIHGEVIKTKTNLITTEGTEAQSQVLICGINIKNKTQKYGTAEDAEAQSLRYDFK